MSEIKTEKKKEDWMQSKWRPAMGWMYMVICTMDMVVFPILWSLLQTTTGTQITQWNPLTLQGAGLFHIAMGAVLGITAFGRTKEKLGGANNGGAAVIDDRMSETSSNFNSPAPSTGFSSVAPNFGTRPAVTQPSFTPSSTFISSNGKSGPIQAPEPEL